MAWTLRCIAWSAHTSDARRRFDQLRRKAEQVDALAGEWLELGAMRTCAKG